MEKNTTICEDLPLVLEKNIYPELLAVLQAMNDCDCAHETSWWNRHFKLPHNRGMMSQFLLLFKSGLVRRYTRRMERSRGYQVMWTLTDNGIKVAEQGFGAVMPVSELYGLLYADCFHPTSLFNRDDIDTVFMKEDDGWRRRRKRTPVV